jgi:L-fucose isomerase-like protein
MEPLTLGVIVGNRGFFPGHLCDTGRAAILKVLEEEGIQAIAISPEEARHGAVESLEEAHKLADLFKQHRDEIGGILITLPNFGDERAIANTIRWSGLEVPVLVHAFPDENAKMLVTDRRDAFCGKMSACNNLMQYGIKYTLTTLHTVDPESESFRQDVRRFAAVCRIVRGLKNARVGVMGARPAPFNTVRYSEKLLERAGISVEVMDLSEAFGLAGRVKVDDPRVTAKIEKMHAYLPFKGVPSESVMRMAKLGVVMDDWTAAKQLKATAVQCWDSVQTFYGVATCTLMSMMSNELMPAACESDIAGVIGMYTMVLASGKPSAIVDWNNNYAEDPNKGIIFHCSNLPKDLFIQGDSPDAPKVGYQEIIADVVGKNNTYGTIQGRLKAQPFTYCRVATDDLHGRIAAYVGEGKLTDDPVSTFGGYGVVEIKNYQKLLAFICENGFEHHVAINPSLTASAVKEAYGKYLGWEVYQHEG